MGLFRRGRSSGRSPNPAIIEFWAWWPTARARLRECPGTDIPVDIAADLSARVAAIHPDLAWDVATGHRAARALTVTCEGAVELRGTTERWVRAAPTGDDQWEFHPARLADPDRLGQPFTLYDHELDLGHISLGLKVSSGRVDVTAYHPDFAFMAEEDRLAVVTQVLTWTLGEDGIARWIGSVTPAIERVVDGLPPSALPGVAEQVGSAYGASNWLRGEGRTPRGHPAQVAVRFPLHRVDYPLFELHVAVSLPYTHANPDRLPVDPSAKALRRFAERLEEQLDGQGVLAGHETGDDRRVLRLFVDPESAAVSEIDQHAAEWPEGRATVRSEPDPGWSAIRPYLP